MPDFPTIANTVRKRIKAIPGVELIGFPDVTVAQFSDAVGVAICVVIFDAAYPLAAKLPVDPLRADVLNAVDRFVEGIKRIKKARLSPRSWQEQRQTFQ